MSRRFHAVAACNIMCSQAGGLCGAPRPGESHRGPWPGLIAFMVAIVGAAHYRIENCTGMLKLIDACFNPGGIAGKGCARRIIASVSLSSEG